MRAWYHHPRARPAPPLLGEWAARATLIVELPRISEFFGLTIYMYWFDTQRHHVPHFHVRYQGDEAVFAIDGTLLEGDLGPRAVRLVTEWCAERAGEIRNAWDCASEGKEIPWVLPLR